jgi:hypothetical protein
MNSSKLVFLLSTFISLSATAQVTYVASTSTSCKSTTEPITKIEFKANPSKQVVIFTYENLKSKEFGSYAESGCTVVDKDNWNCATSYAINGVAFKRDKDGDDYRYCHYEKKIFGGWLPISNGTISKSVTNKSYDTSSGVISYLTANLKADIFKASDCRSLLKQVNPTFYKKAHLNDAVLYLQLLYSNDANVMRSLTDTEINSFKKSVGVKISQSILDELGDSPSASKCGLITAGIEGQIDGSRARLTSK